jgi:ribose/xylose/arabinose/galactoside ABC-type transport system permease subunit
MSVGQIELKQDRPLASLRSFIISNPILTLLVAMFIGAILFVPNFVTPFNLQNLVLQAIDILIVAVGMTFVVLNGGIDFSVTSVMALGSVVGAWVMVGSPAAGTPFAIPAGIIAMLLIGALMGTINGFSVVLLKMPSFIATLATMMVGSGVAVWFTSLVSERAAVNGLPSDFFLIGGVGNNLVIPVLLSVVVLVVTHWLLTYTLFGRRVYAIGTNPKTSFISGIPVKKTIFMMMLISGLCAGLAAVYATARNQAGLPSLGDKIFIDIVAAIIIGGTSIFGGSGGIKQTLYGVLFITLINNVVNLLAVEWYVITLIKGLLVLIAAFLDYFSRRVDLARA